MKEKQLESHDKALDICQVTFNYDKTPVLWDVSFFVPTSSVAGLVGPNGAGKSTLIKIVMNMIKPISGQIKCFGNPIKKVLSKVAYVPQKESVDWDFPITVLDLVLMGRYRHLGMLRWPRKADKVAAIKYLKFVEMDKYASRQINQLSTGQQQRVFIARALIQEADLYLMDEPFSGVDASTEKIIMDLFHQLKAQGKTIFVVHHDLNTVCKYFDWIVMLNTRTIAYGEVNKIFNKDTINRTYGKTNTLFEEVMQLSQNQSSGLFK